PGLSRGRAGGLGDRRPRARSVCREAGFQRGGRSRRVGEVTASSVGEPYPEAQRSGDDHGEESEEGKVEDQESEEAGEGRPGPQEKARRRKEKERGQEVSQEGKAEGEGCPERRCSEGRESCRAEEAAGTAASSGPRADHAVFW